MSLIDFILNVAGLLLWLNWRAVRFDPLAQTSAATLVGTLRRADPKGVKRWQLLAALAGLLLLRALFYWQIGAAVNWNANLKLVVISLSFRSDFLSRMLLFSVLSFGLTLAVFFLWLLFLSFFDCRNAETNPLRKLARFHLGRVDLWPWPVKLVLPLLAGMAVWWLLSWPLARWSVIPHPVSTAHRLEQALLVGLSSYLTWKYLVAAFLTLHLVSSYVYLGNHPFWNGVNGTARTLLTPLGPLPLRAGKVDFAPVLGLALVFLAVHLAEWGLTALYPKLPI